MMKLNNSDIPKDLDKKLGHLPELEKTQIKSLLHYFTAFFPDAPGMTSAVVYHVDLSDIAPIKQHTYRVNPVECA